MNVSPITLRYKVYVYADLKVIRVLETEIIYESSRYAQVITVPVGYKSDGATKAITPPGSRSYWVHDLICDVARWNDGTPINAWQAATVLSDILAEEAEIKRKYGRWLSATISKARSFYWFVATYIGGCVNTRKNGWF